jgi:hypothetical protein
VYPRKGTFSGPALQLGSAITAFVPPCVRRDALDVRAVLPQFPLSGPLTQRAAELVRPEQSPDDHRDDHRNALPKVISHDDLPSATDCVKRAYESTEQLASNRLRNQRNNPAQASPTLSEHVMRREAEAKETEKGECVDTDTKSYVSAAATRRSQICKKPAGGQECAHQRYHPDNRRRPRPQPVLTRRRTPARPFRTIGHSALLPARYEIFGTFTGLTPTPRS